jgi:transposase-like protein
MALLSRGHYRRGERVRPGWRNGYEAKRQQTEAGLMELAVPHRLERLNGESRRRTKVIPRFPTERACLTLLYASLVTASKRWRGIPVTAKIAQQLQGLRPANSASNEEAVA